MSGLLTVLLSKEGALLAGMLRGLNMAGHQSPEQKKTVQRVMHEFKHGELKTAAGKRKVKNPKQAIAIALHEAGASKYESPKKNAENLRHTKKKEQRGETYQDEKEGHRATQASYQRATKRSGPSGSRKETGSKTRAELYDEARRQDIPNRSKMNKAELERALSHA
jgi:hypothetical protein